MNTDHHNEYEAQIGTMLEKVFRIIHEGMILHEYLTDKEFATLAITLKNIHPPLRNLRIIQCAEKPLSTYALTQLLQDNITLESFHLEANQIDSSGLIAIAEILKQNKKLQQFYCGLLVNGLPVEGVLALSDMLIANMTLKNLNLYANKIDSEKTKIIADALAKNPNLENLGLASNEIGTDGAMALADALTKNTKLQELNISDCRLGKEGLNAIFTALKQNSALKTLTLRRLSSDIIPTLANMIAENKNLKKLNLSLYTSELSTDQINLLLDALKKNKSLQFLNIHDDDGKLKSTINEINQLLKNNMAPAAAPPAEATQEAAKRPETEGEAKTKEEKDVKDAKSPDAKAAADAKPAKADAKPDPKTETVK